MKVSLLRQRKSTCCDRTQATPWALPALSLAGNRPGVTQQEKRAHAHVPQRLVVTALYWQNRSGKVHCRSAR